MSPLAVSIQPLTQAAYIDHTSCITDLQTTSEGLPCKLALRSETVGQHRKPERCPIGTFSFQTCATAGRLQMPEVDFARSIEVAKYLSQVPTYTQACAASSHSSGTQRRSTVMPSVDVLIACIAQTHRNKVTILASFARSRSTTGTRCHPRDVRLNRT